MNAAGSRQASALSIGIGFYDHGTMSIIDPALVAALDIHHERREEFDRDPAAEHAIWQTSSIDALLDGASKAISRWPS